MTEYKVETQRLIMRRFSADDWCDLHEYLSQAEVVRYEPYEIFTEEQSRSEAVRRSANDSFWAVCLKDSGKLIGNIYLDKQEFETWELGYVFNVKFHGKGYAAESAAALIGDLFENRGARRITAKCNPLNTSSWKLLERLGFRREGHLISDKYFKKDKTGQPLWTDTYEYAILRTEWK